VRTQETATLLMRTIPGAQSVVSVPTFYAASPETVLQELAGAQEPDGKLMLLGHNPCWQTLTGYFSGQMQDMPTAAVCILTRTSSSAPWYSNASWELQEHLTPQSL